MGHIVVLQHIGMPARAVCFIEGVGMEGVRIRKGEVWSGFFFLSHLVLRYQVGQGSRRAPGAYGPHLTLPQLPSYLQLPSTDCPPAEGEECKRGGGECLGTQLMSEGKGR